MAQEKAVLGAEVLLKRRRWAPEFLRRLVLEKPLGAVGGFIVVAVVLAAVLADVIAPYPYDEIHLTDTIQAPNGTYILGTDGLGRDLLSRMLFGARVSMYVALGAVSLGLVYAVVLGIPAAWFGGLTDTLISRFVDAKMTIPTLLLLLLIASILGPGLGNIILVLSLAGIIEARIVRGQALSIKQNVYVEGATAIGASKTRTMTHHILPNIFAPLIILATLRFGSIIISEATLSFLGYGVPPPFPSWGRMLSQESRLLMQQAPWLAIAPGVALTLTVWGFNVFGDALRDLLDPRLRGTGKGHS